MTPQALRQLTPGTTYRVRITGGRTYTRIFKWTETRFRSILCGVFTTRLRSPLSATVLGKKRLRFTGSHIPRGEWSVPHYDLISCEETRL